MEIPDGFAMLEDRGSFLDLVGPVYVADGPEPVVGLRLQARHTNKRGTIMGGMLATLVDVAFGLAIEADAGDKEDRATASLTVDYLKPASVGDWIEAHVSVNRVGSTLAFADCSLKVGEQEVVRARSVWASAA